MEVINNEVMNKTEDKVDHIWQTFQCELDKHPETEKKRNKIMKKIKKLRNTELNIMLVGATGCGKSSTINAMFSCAGIDATDNNYVEVAKVGTKADPETKDIEKYTIGNLILWDTPGLGDGTEIDEHHKKVITELLEEKTDDGNSLIDMVLVILDGSTRDLGTSYKILHDVIIPVMGINKKRIVVALNQADIAMKTGRHWNYDTNCPDEILLKFLEAKVVSIKKRIAEDTGLELEPIYYCAGYKEPDGAIVRPYNLTKLLYYILKTIPAKKRIPILEGMNDDKGNYQYNDEDYSGRVKQSFFEAVAEAAEIGAEFGKYYLGYPGALVGGVVGGVLGAVDKLIGDLL